MRSITFDTPHFFGNGVLEDALVEMYWWDDANNQGSYNT